VLALIPGQERPSAPETSRPKAPSRNGQYPRENLRLSFEKTGLAPHTDKNVADDILSQ
jgi:hypothetical protein